MNLKVLWACGNDQFNEVKEEFITLLESKGYKVVLVEKYHKLGIVNELKNTQYDLLITQEYLEKKAFEIEMLEAIIESYSGMRTLFIIDNHDGDTYAQRLINIGLSGSEGDVLYYTDLSANELFNLYTNPRKRMEAKIYLHLTKAGDIDDNKKVEQHIISNILIYLNAEDTIEKKQALYEHISSQYDMEQNLYILQFFPDNLLQDLHSHHLVSLFINSNDTVNNKASKTKIKDNPELHKQIKELKKQLDMAKNQDPRIITKEVAIYVDRPVVQTPDDYKKVICFEGLNGTGKSTLCINAAVDLIRKGKKVAVIEADLENRAVYHNIKIDDMQMDKTYNVFLHNSLEMVFLNIKKDKLLDYAVVNNKYYDNLYLFCLANDATYINNHSYSRTLDLNGQETDLYSLYELLIKKIKPYVDVIFIDTSQYFYELNEALYNLCDSVIYIVDSDYVRMNRHMEYIQEKKLRNVPLGLFKPVINKFNKNAGRPHFNEIYDMLSTKLNPFDRSKTILLPIEESSIIPVIPYDDGFVTCSWAGEPYLDSSLIREDVKEQLSILSNLIYQDTYIPESGIGNKFLKALGINRFFKKSY
ncbi:MAG: division plane positioning ATPase MipZ [Clostridia bacterium]